ncbi:MAG: tRNA 4-thiouridine(8) synthase ThiI [Nanoarchaeota archaeon]|nr:tRNA 4-thiouridine(8) synthase ThiI [Nanoarchaeota archaeon]
MDNCILLRYGEVGLKSNRTRPFFERKYLLAIKDALKRNYIDDFKIDNLGGRFVIYTNKVNDASEVLIRVSGIQSISPAYSFKFSSKEDLIKKVKKASEKLVSDKIFSISIRRVGKHDFNSIDLTKEIGSSIYNLSKGVNLKNPDVAIHLEIRKDECFLFTKIIDGVGGLPTGISDKVLCLFSGGIDSPVAAFEMMKRGSKIDFLFVNIMDEKLLYDISKIYNFLITKYCFGYEPRIYVVDGKKIIEQIKKDVESSLRQIAYKIALYKISEEIIKESKHLAIVTGEALAQKSSQTLESLLFIEKQSSVHVLRPLICFDKIDIMKKARFLGTFSMSEKIKEYCNLSSGPVTTAPKKNDLNKITLSQELIVSAVKNMIVTKGILDVKNVKPACLECSSEIVSVDIRSVEIQKKIPLKTSLNIPYSKIWDHLDEFEKNNSYLFVCEFGVLSENVAFALKKKGVNAAGISVRDFENYFKKK